VPVIPNGLPSILEIAPDIGIVVCTSRTQGDFHVLVQLPVALPRPRPQPPGAAQWAAWLLLLFRR